MSTTKLHKNIGVTGADSMDEVLVSVIVCTYNQEKYIAQTLEAILCQKTDFRFEILVGDDASDDKTPDILRDYEEWYPDIVRAFCREKNVGSCRNYYEMLSHAAGAYISNCDGDDWWSSEYKLQKDIDILKKHNEYIAVVSGVQPVDENGEPMKEEDVPVNRRFWLYDKGEYTKDDFEKWKMPGHGCTLTHRNIYCEKRIDPTILYEASRNVGDRTIMMLLTHFGKIYCDKNRVGVNYRMQFGANAKNNMTAYENRNVRDDEVRGIRCMELWAEKYLKKKSDMNFVKKDRLSSSVVIFLKTPTFENLCVIHRLCKYSGESLKYHFYAVKAMLMKLYYWNILREDRRVVL